MVFFPDLCYPNVSSIPIDDLLEHHVKAIAIDVDNTLIDYTKVLQPEIIEWVKQIKQTEIQICILSNSNRLEKIAKVANTLQIDFVLNAKKPLRSGFKKVMQKFQLPAENIAIIGDQIFTDVMGANKMKMLSIYVEPINKKEYWYTKWKRPMESWILKMRKNERGN